MKTDAVSFFCSVLFVLFEKNSEYSTTVSVSLTNAGVFKVRWDKLISLVFK